MLAIRKIPSFSPINNINGNFCILQNCSSGHQNLDYLEFFLLTQAFQEKLGYYLSDH